MNNVKREPIAIIGMSCRFPGGIDDLEAFWEVLKNGEDKITDIPKDRWDISRYYHPDRLIPGKTNTHWGGFVDKIADFDAHYFGISPREASLLDPQQRLLLEVSTEALEDAGQVMKALRGSDTSVFMGGFTIDYQLVQFADKNRELIDAHTATGTMMTLLANRLSYQFDFRGPSVAVDTACSSSLVAVHLACQSIWNGESGLALAGGVNVMLKPDLFIAESKAGMLSPTGRSRAFDTRANGYVRGEGAGVIVLKPLSKALADGDRVHAVIRGTGINQDGQSNGITVPRSESQMVLMRSVYKQAGVKSNEIQYVEAHGTGTPVGDPIEANAIGMVLSEHRTLDDKLIMGSVKTNIGHTEAAAGIAGVIKTVLAMKHGKIPPHLHLQEVNHQIDLEKLRMHIPTKLTDWPSEGLKLAGVNSFGFGGTNAHVVLEEAPTKRLAKEKADTTEARSYLIPLSGKSENALKALAKKFANWLSHSCCQIELEELGSNLAHRRDHYPYLLGTVAHSKEQLIDNLTAFVDGERIEQLSTGISEPISSNQPLKTAFVFTGMGPQWWAMGHQLYKTEPVFRRAVDKCDEVFKEISGWSIVKEMLASEENSRMGETEIAQPANFVIQVGLSELWKHWGIVPDSIVGHSAGEVATAYFAGALNLQDAIKVIYHRSRVQQKTTGQGKMVAVGLSQEQAVELITAYDEVSIAAVNSPDAVTLAGNPEMIQCIVDQLDKEGIFAKYLRVKVPYHSHYMDPLKAEILDALQDISPKDTAYPLYSTVTGRRIEGSVLTPEYWWENIRNPVLFAASMNAMLEDDFDVFIEIGPHPVLASSILECKIKKSLSKEITILHSIKRQLNERQSMLSNLASMYTLGYEINWNELYAKHDFVPFPTYEWQKEKYWHETTAAQEERIESDTHPLLGRRLDSPNPTWETEVDCWKTPFLKDHKIQGNVVFPGTGYVEMALVAFKEVYGEGNFSFSIDDLKFEKALFIQESQTVKMRLMLYPKDSTFEIFSLNPKTNVWLRHTSGMVKLKQIEKVPIIDVSKLQSENGTAISSERCYQFFRTVGLEYGETFQGIQELWQDDLTAFASNEIPDEVYREVSDFIIHPAVLDVCFQVLAAGLPFGDDLTENSTVFMPISSENVKIYGSLTKKMWIHANITEYGDDHGLTGDIVLINDRQETVVEIKQCHAMSLKNQTVLPSKELGLQELKWLPKLREKVIKQNKKLDKWLIFCDEFGKGDDIGSYLEKKGYAVIKVYPSERFKLDLKNEHVYINPNSIDDFKKLFESLDRTEFCQGIIHLWSLSKEEDLTLSGLEKAEKLGPITTMHLIQSIERRDWKVKPILWTITNGAQFVDGNEKYIHAEHGMLWGLARSAGHIEHKALFKGIIDVDAHLGDFGVADVVEEILNNDGEDQIAYRNHHRHVIRLVDKVDSGIRMPARFHSDCSYLITGGLGSLGLLVAEWMIEKGARRLILAGRTELPPRREWNLIDEQSSIGKRITEVRKLEKMGAVIQVVGFDITSEKELSRFLKEYELDGWPPIKGIIHSAGVAKPELLLNMTQKGFSTVLHPKVYGAWNLHKQFLNQSLDFFVMFSSTASIVVSEGQANYSAGNAFLDSLAHYRKLLGEEALSINWGPWGEIGMATQLDLFNFFEKRGFHPMTNDQGLEALEQLFNQSSAQAFVLAATWETIKKMNYPLGIAPPMIQDLVKKEQVENTNDEATDENQIDILTAIAQTNDPVSQFQLLENYLHDVAVMILRIKKQNLSAADPLSNWGLDSMMAIEMKNRIELGLGISVAVVDLLKGSSVSQLAENLLSKLDLSNASEDQQLEELLEGLSLEEIDQLLLKSSRRG